MYIVTYGLGSFSTVDYLPTLGFLSFYPSLVILRFDVSITQTAEMELIR